MLDPKGKEEDKSSDNLSIIESSINQNSQRNLNIQGLPASLSLIETERLALEGRQCLNELKVWDWIYELVVLPTGLVISGGSNGTMQCLKINAKTGQ